MEPEDKDRTSKASPPAQPWPGWHRRKLDICSHDADGDHPVNTQRTDTDMLKRLLSAKLGNAALDYWRALRTYMTGKLSHAEFERRALDCLGPSNLHLHNKFMLGILHNAKSYVPPPLGAASKGFPPLRSASVPGIGEIDLDNEDHVELLVHGNKRAAASSSVMTDAARRRKRRRDILSLAPEDRERLESLPTREPPAPHLKHLHQIQSPENAMDLVDRLDPAPALCTDLYDLPSRDMMRSRLRLLAALSGLSDDVPNSCIDLLSIALENHLNNIVGNCLRKAHPAASTRISAGHAAAQPSSAITGQKSPMVLGALSPRSPPTTPGGGPANASQQNNIPKRMLLDIDALDFAFRMSPHLVTKSTSDLEVLDLASSLRSQEPDTQVVSGVEIRKCT
ncbi:MAG: hypothetical protein SGCHY_004222 [Lobulomycetales sp.]